MQLKHIIEILRGFDATAQIGFIETKPDAERVKEQAGAALEFGVPIR